MAIKDRFSENPGSLTRTNHKPKWWFGSVATWFNVGQRVDPVAVWCNAGQRNWCKFLGVTFNLDKAELHAPKAGNNNNANGKRKRAAFRDEKVILLSNTTGAINNVTTAIRETIPKVVHPELYHVVMDTPGFTQEALIVAFSHLLDNKAQSQGFVGMTEEHRVLWLRTYLSKNYYN
uniref:Uncharacterized protein n=1 Tax=Oryza brachyantha TaxID=4533 RepID=J3N7Q0_ORYBR